MMSVGHLQGQFHDERRASAGAAVDMHGSPELLNDAANDVEPQSQTIVLSGCHGAFERLEDSPVKVGGDTEPAGLQRPD